MFSHSFKFKNNIKLTFFSSFFFFLLSLPFFFLPVDEKTESSISKVTDQSNNVETRSIDDSEESRGGTVIYDHTFDLTNIECQAHLLRMCRSISIRKDLVQQSGSSCVLSDFQNWLRVQKQLTFPLEISSKSFRDPKLSLTYLLYSFITQDVIGKRHSAYVLFDTLPTGEIGDPSRVLAIINMFYSTTRNYQGGFSAMQTYSKWDSMLTQVNEDAPKSTGGPAFHTSDLWTRAITEVIAVLGTMSGIGFVLLSAFLAIWSFTSSVRAAAVCTGVLLCVLSTTTGLFYLFGWELGIVEAVGISILLGACVDYPAHVVERFVELDGHGERENQNHHNGIHPSNPLMNEGQETNAGTNEGINGSFSSFSSSSSFSTSASSSNHFVDRKKRVVHAMSSVGVSVLNASMTTVCSCTMLVFCTVQVFNRVGVIMLTASAVSMTATLFMVPSILAVFGPLPFLRSWRYRIKIGCLVFCIGLVSFLIVYVINVSLGRPLF